MVTVVLFFAAALVMLYANRGTVVEQRLSANEMRAKQAFAAANAGIDQALAHMRNGGTAQNAPDPAAPVFDTFAVQSLASGTTTIARYSVAFCDPAWAPPACPATAAGGPIACGGGAAPSDFHRVVVVSCGWSDDNSSAQRVVQALENTPSTGGGVSTPLVTRGTANLLTGGASVFNYFNDLTVWSGGNLLGQSNTAKTFVRDVADTAHVTPNPSYDYRDTGNSPNCGSPLAGYTCATQGGRLGHDTVRADTNLSTLSNDAFFEKFFDKLPLDYRDSAANYKVDLSGGLTDENSTSIESLSGMTDRIIWVEGPVTTLPASIGTEKLPVILVINGNLELGASPVINGLVYVRGNVTGNGSPEIYGSLIVEGDANLTGNPKLIYDPMVIRNVSNLGSAGKVSGGFRDW